MTFSVSFLHSITLSWASSHLVRCFAAGSDSDSSAIQKSTKDDLNVVRCYECMVSLALWAHRCMHAQPWIWSVERAAWCFERARVRSDRQPAMSHFCSLALFLHRSSSVKVNLNLNGHTFTSCLWIIVWLVGEREHTEEQRCYCCSWFLNSQKHCKY